MKKLDPSTITPVEPRNFVSDDVICVPGGYAPKVTQRGNTIEIEGKHYYSQEYVDALVNDKVSGVGKLLGPEDEEEFGRWHMKLLNSHMTKDTSSLGSCLLRDLVRDKRVLTMMRVVWYDNFIRDVGIQDE